jgi:hypothetical protein
LGKINTKKIQRGQWLTPIILDMWEAELGEPQFWPVQACPQEKLARPYPKDKSRCDDAHL